MSDFRIKTYTLGMVSTNCYFLYHEQEKKVLIVDPGDNAAFILNKCRELELEPAAILLTHGHFDHMMAVNDLKRSFPVPVYASGQEAEFLESPEMNLSWSMAGERMSVKPDVCLKDGQEFEMGGCRIRVIFTPGHTGGSVCYYIEEEGILLSGDTLFADSYGRTDLPTGSTGKIMESINEKLLILPEDTMVYPGHGDPTTIGHEKVYNPAAAYRG